MRGQELTKQVVFKNALPVFGGCSCGVMMCYDIILGTLGDGELTHLYPFIIHKVSGVRFLWSTLIS